jgi:DNA-binding MarR family transcriptional regulator
MDHVPAAGPRIDEDALRGLIRLSRQAETAMVEFSLSLAQYRVLDRLSGGRAVGKSLAEWLAVRPPTVTSLVDGLVARGLVRRTVDESDRRRVSHELTGPGRETYRAVTAAIAARLERVARHADDPEQAAAMIGALAAWNAALGRASATHPATPPPARRTGARP